MVDFRFGFKPVVHVVAVGISALAVAGVSAFADQSVSQIFSEPIVFAFCERHVRNRFLRGLHGDRPGAGILRLIPGHAKRPSIKVIPKTS
jgi:hypothetical protein